MTSTRSLTILALTLAIVGAAMVGTTATAHEQDFSGKRMNRAMRFEYRADVHTAIENNDYKTWKELTQGSPIQSIIENEEDFAMLVEAHMLMEEGNLEEAQEIFNDLGIDKPFAGGHRHVHGLGLRVFLELNDTEAQKLDEARALFLAGETQEAQDMLDEIRDSFRARNMR